MTVPQNALQEWQDVIGDVLYGVAKNEPAEIGVTFEGDLAGLDGYDADVLLLSAEPVLFWETNSGHRINGAILITSNSILSSVGTHCSGFSTISAT
jgi:hypothetical protein